MNKWRILIILGLLTNIVIHWFIPALKSFEWIGTAAAWFAIGRISVER